MADRRPLVNISGTASELPVGDRLSDSLYEGGQLVQVLPGAATSLTALGTIVTTAGTVSHAVVTTANYLSSCRRSTFTGAATAGSLIYLRQAALMIWRGNAANRGGFRFINRFGLETLVAGNRVFVGLADSVANPANIDPLTNTTPGKVGMACSNNTGNWQLVNNASGTAPTVLDLGANFPVNGTDGLELVLACLPNASGIDYTVINKSTGISTSGTLTTNIPSNTTFLAPLFWMSNNATAAAFAFANIRTQLTSPN